MINLLGNASTQAHTLPAGFSRVQVASGISKPTVMAFTPDGRILVAQQDGILRVIKNGKLLSTPFMQLPVTSNGERGLIGLTLDPNFASNQYLYVYYTVRGTPRNRISRFTAKGDVVVPGSEVVVLNLDPLSSANNHNGGAMHFGKDGKLYVAIGENANPAQSQDLNTYHGKLLRINPNGSIPAGNPYTTGSAQKKRIWASGLRNPYTFAVQPGTGRIFVNDVGQVTWEEINDASAGGKNFGWPVKEGFSTDPAYANPVFAYPHGSEDGTGCAITGGVFFNPITTNYPAAYQGRYFFQDLCSKWINVLDLSSPTPIRQPFATNLGDYALGITVGTDGNLYYLERSTSAVYKIIYTTNAAPRIEQQPANLTVAAGQPATFKVTATGTAPLTYQWQKNGVNISGATAATYTIASTKAADAGNYRVVVANAAGKATSNAASLKVTAFNNRPVAVINYPTETFRYRGGDVIRFIGDATDTEDGTLPASAFTWFVDFHHDTHHHDGPAIADGVKSGSFVIPTSGEVSANVWYRLYAVVKDAGGLTDTIYRDIHPYRSTISLTTQPAGLKLTLDGQPVNTPIAVNSVEGIMRNIGPVNSQTLNGKTYVFEKWLHGGSANQTISTPKDNVTYTAVYREAVSSALLEAENAVVSGVQVSNDHAGYTGTGFANYLQESNDYIEWTVSVPTAGTYNLSFRYALVGSSRHLRLQVNNANLASELEFPETGQWTSWSNKEINISLTAGSNTIRLTATGTSGPNLDHLVVSPNSSAPAQASTKETVATEPVLQVYPNPANSYLKVRIPFTSEQKYTVQLYNNQGKLVHQNLSVKPVLGQNTLLLPTANLPVGLYIVKILQGKTSLSKVFFIRR
ncbi:PQQ-dependent sugar dehydrogenase [Adhaeribacter arboris]|uniref:PQQ-dependent sugar dehydrogenase n=1 Tax=Adhaeribacter arboris TaxID=2072846 RepID=UPI0011B1E44C|nr:PQQ-dependent sugar dehydrogenase [Adhaeribacter arboris]